VSVGSRPPLDPPIARHCEERQRRSNPDRPCGEIVDCFASLAKTNRCVGWAKARRRRAHPLRGFDRRWARGACHRAALRADPLALPTLRRLLQTFCARHCEERQRRSNPDRPRGEIVDCFASLAMTVIPFRFVRIAPNDDGRDLPGHREGSGTFRSSAYACASSIVRCSMISRPGSISSPRSSAIGAWR
jgi:hypothetical protein